MNSRSTQRLVWGILATALFIIGGFALYKWMHDDVANRVLEDYGALPAFSLTDEHGQLVTNADLKGHVWVADLIFTHCTSICPILTSKMLALQHQLADQKDVKLVSFSVDPKHDTPDTLAAYAAAHKADTRQWTFLTGAVPTIYGVIKTGFHLPLDSVGGDQSNPIIHSPRFALVDGQGHVRGYYRGQDDDARKQILADIQVLKAQQ